MDSPVSPLHALQLIAGGASSIDVRAPVEFEKGSLPSAMNSPILNNEQRTEIGVCYKSKGPEAATRLGHRLVSGDLKEERVADWLSQLQQDQTRAKTFFMGHSAKRNKRKMKKEN